MKTKKELSPKIYKTSSARGSLKKNYCPIF